MKKLFITILTIFALSFAATPIPPASAASKLTRAKTYVSDSAITAELKGKFLAEKGLDSLDIKVTTTRGVVTLRGQVEKAFQSRLAEKIARETSGVRGVLNKISVMP